MLCSYCSYNMILKNRYVYGIEQFEAFGLWLVDLIYPSHRLGPGSTAAPLLRGTWLHAAEQRGSNVTRHSRYRGRGPHFLMTFHLPASAKSNKSSCSGLSNELKFEF